jgi:hypothetical protein
MARNCKSPKKKRIPKPKAAYTIGKEIYIIERLTSLNNKDKFKFYHFKSKLLEALKALDEEQETKIPN